MRAIAAKQDTRGGSIEKLEECLRAELAAVETYDLAVRAVAARDLGGLLRRVRDSHERRAILLWSLVIGAGGEAPGATGGVARRAEVFDGRLVQRLLEGEDRGVRLYVESLETCDLKTRALIEEQLLPEQRETRDVCASLRSLVNP